MKVQFPAPASVTLAPALVSLLTEAVSLRFGTLPSFALVVGDLMLDRYHIGKVERISPEAPVPVVLLKETVARAGGAANVAANLAALGIPVRIAGCVGEDAEAKQLRDLLEAVNIDTSAVCASPRRPTICKTRILGGHQQIIRLDQEDASPLDVSEQESLWQGCEEALAQGPAVIILSDYAKGVLTPAFCQRLLALARRMNIPVLVDPKGRDYAKYQGATALTPNKREAAEACGLTADNDTTLLQQAEKLRLALGLAFLAITRGEEGISVLDASGQAHFPATARQVFDVSGAGDTVIATLAAGLMHGLDHHASLMLANIAAGIVVGKVGTIPVNRQELLHELAARQTQQQADKICTLAELTDRVAGWRSLGQTLVFTNGCFDLLHAGHVTYLEAARKLGDKLVLGLNTDRSVRALKGDTRPVIHEQDRARVLAALEAVDAVILFDEDTPLNLIAAVRPDVLVKGNDYREDEVVGGQEVKSWGGKVALVEIVPGRSTSGILQKIAQ